MRSVIAAGARVRVRINDRKPGPLAEPDGTYKATILHVGRSGLSATVEYDCTPGIPQVIWADMAQVYPLD